MLWRLLLPALILACLGPAVTASPATPPPAQAQVRFVDAYPQLRFFRPIWFGQLPGTDHVIVVEQAGRVLAFPDDRDAGPNQVRELLNMMRDVRYGGEQGLLGLAFDPDFENNRYLYLHYNASNPRRSVLSRWTLPPGGRIDADSEHVILEVDQPWNNHNGGHIEFGPDGYLYFALGDGGAGGDPLDSGQDLTTLLGTILRIDVHPDAPDAPDAPDSADAPYAIPDDNPFADHDTARPEIFAYGLRNVWRFTFDQPDLGGDGRLWAGDVGQNAREEISIIQPGGNYGWRVYEGFAPFRPNEAQPSETYLPPVVDHPHSEAASITGGIVYRGTDVPALQGHYIYGDYVHHNLWAIAHDGNDITAFHHLGRARQPVHFGINHARELHIATYGGQILRMTPRNP
jgi:glucose/arabinose dehydrogenase